MTKREWKKVWRVIRVARRETAKAYRDMMLFGTGAVLITKDGDPKHIPVEQLRFEVPHA